MTSSMEDTRASPLVAGGTNVDAVSCEESRSSAGRRTSQLRHLSSVLSESVGHAPLKELVEETVSAVERQCIEAALASTRGNRSAAAKLLGLSRQALYMKLARYEIALD
jgi:DNA-binding NtrC family response regulator